MPEMFSPTTTTNTSAGSCGVSLELRGLIEKLKEKRGPNEHWMEMEHAIMKRVGSCVQAEHVWCRGEVHGKDRHYPAFVVFNRDTGKLQVLAPSGTDFTFEEHDYRFFCSSIPHIGICREVLTEDQTGCTV